MVEALHEAVVRFDDTRSRFVATSLLALPTRRLRRAARHEQAWARACRSYDSRTADAIAEASADALLAGAVAAGVLSAADAERILETRIAGHSLRAAARRQGLPYETAKKRRQRAEARWASWWSTSAAESRSQDVA